MKNSSRPSVRSSLSTASLIAALSAAGALLAGCGADDPEVEDDAGAVTGEKDSGTPSSAGSDLAMEFAEAEAKSICMGGIFEPAK